MFFSSTWLDPARVAASAYAPTVPISQPVLIIRYQKPNWAKDVKIYMTFFTYRFFNYKDKHEPD